MHWTVWDEQGLPLAYLQFLDQPGEVGSLEAERAGRPRLVSSRAVQRISDDLSLVGDHGFVETGGRIRRKQLVRAGYGA